jgi:hypothetical protein
MEFNPLSAKLDEAKAYNGKQRIVNQSFCVVNQTPQQFAPTLKHYIPSPDCFLCAVASKDHDTNTLV